MADFWTWLEPSVETRRRRIDRRGQSRQRVERERRGTDVQLRRENMAKDTPGECCGASWRRAPREPVIHRDSVRESERASAGRMTMGNHKWPLELQRDILGHMAAAGVEANAKDRRLFRSTSGKRRN